MAKQPDSVQDATFGGLPGLGGTIIETEAASSRGRVALHGFERKLLLVVGDAVAWLVSGVLVVAVLHPPRYSFATGPRSATIASLAVISWWLWAWINGAYDLNLASKESSILSVLVRAAVLQALVFVGLAFTERGLTGRTVWAVWLVSGLILTSFWRTVYLSILTLPFFAKNVVFVGNDPFLQQLSALLAQRSADQYHVLGHMDGSMGDDDTATNGAVDYLKRVVERMNISELVVGAQALASRPTLEGLVECRNLGVKITPAEELYEQLLQQVPVGQIDHHWIMELPMRAQQNRIYIAVKRLVDIVLASVGLILFAILLPFIAAAIWLDSRRPIFYSQLRTGYRGRTFRVWKLRTMRRNAEANNEARWTVPGDERITRVGRFLRRARLDELPQLWNIVRGDMSFVGPRPERPEFVDQLEKVIPFYRTRLSVKPGLTGWAQVNEGYGSSVEDAVTKLQYDLYYVKQQSLLLDLKCIGRTVSSVVALKGR